MSIEIFSPFSSGLYTFLLLNYKSSLLHLLPASTSASAGLGPMAALHPRRSRGCSQPLRPVLPEVVWNCFNQGAANKRRANKQTKVIFKKRVPLHIQDASFFFFHLFLLVGG